MQSFYSQLPEGMHLCLVAPSPSRIPPHCLNILEDAYLHDRLLDKIQQLRGHVYVEDGAIPATALDEQGRHRVDHDCYSWHLIMCDAYERICAVMRFVMHFRSDGPLDFQTLHVYQLLTRMQPTSRREYEPALRKYVENSCAMTPCFFEAGGLAVDSRFRKGSVSPIVVLSGWALCRAIGGAMGIGTLTTRHNFAAIGKRFGGFAIPNEKTNALMQFSDAYYGCDVEIMGFASDRLSPFYEATVSDIHRALDVMPVFTT